MSAASERHNHVTRDIKPRGKCPACDAYRDRRKAAIDEMEDVVSAESEREALTWDLSTFLFTIYDHGTSPNARSEAEAIIGFLESKGFRRIDPDDEALVEGVARAVGLIGERHHFRPEVCEGCAYASEKARAALKVVTK